MDEVVTITVSKRSLGYAMAALALDAVNARTAPDDRATYVAAIDELTAASTRSATADDPMGLLRGWMEWWEQADEAPAKMPNGLHVRTAVVLTLNTDWQPSVARG